MVFCPLADWKVRLWVIGMLGREVSGLLGSWCVVERRSDWMTRPTRRRVLYQSKTSSIVTCWSCHHCAISRHMTMSNALQSLLDRSFLVSGCLSGKYHALFII